MGDITEQNSANSEPSRLVMLLGSLLIWAGAGLIAAIFAMTGWSYFNAAPPKPALVVAEKPPAQPAPVAAEKPPPAPEPQPPADHPLASEAVQPAADPGLRDLLDHGWGLMALPYSRNRWQEARVDFATALDIDHESNEARIGLAYILGGKLSDGWSPVLQEDPKKAEQLLVEVLKRGDMATRMSEAHLALGVVWQMQNRLPEAEREFALSVALDPNNARAQLHLGESLLYLGSPNCTPFEAAVGLSPSGYPIAAISDWGLGTCHLLAGNLGQAIDRLAAALVTNDKSWVPYLYLAGAYGLQGDFEKARSALAESLRLKPALRSFARMRAENPWLGNPQYWDLQERTLNVGLRRAGFPDQ